VVVSSNTTLAATHPVKDNNNVDLTLYPGTKFVSNVEMGIYYKVSDGTETSITVTTSAAGIFSFSVYKLSGANTASPTDVAAGQNITSATPSTGATASLNAADGAAIFLIGGTLSENYTAMTNLGTYAPTWTGLRNNTPNGVALGCWSTTFTGPSGTLNQQVSCTSGNESLAVATFQAKATADVTVALTGVSATGAVGTDAVLHDQAVTGVAATATVGTTAPSTTVAVTGNAATASVGSVTPSASVSLTGVVATTSVGTTAPSTTVAVTGVEATGAVGTVTASIGGDITAPVTGVSSTGTVGTLAPSTTVATTGVSAAGAVGTVVPASLATITGVVGTAAAGTLTPSTTVTVSGVAAAAAVGGVAPGTAVGLIGVAATGAVGTVTVSAGSDLSVAISGVAATGSIGNLAPSFTVSVSGVAATGSVGTVQIPGAQNPLIYLLESGRLARKITAKVYLEL